MTSRRTPVRSCPQCGCTDAQACEGGCSWVEGSELCSACFVPHYTNAELEQIVAEGGGKWDAGFLAKVLLSERAKHKIVGHKTNYTPERGFWHEPMFAIEANALIASCDANDALRAKVMPDETSAIRLMFEAGLRLKDFGWKDAIYCPKDGSTFSVLEFGSTGKHPCIYEGEWPTGDWWIVSDGDMSPSRPVLWKPMETPPKERA